MSFIDAVKHCFQNYANFSGIASKSEFWYWVLFYVLVYFITLPIDNMLAYVTGITLNPLFTIVFFGLITPWLAVLVRRLRAVGLHWALAFLQLIPGLGALIVTLIAGLKEDVYTAVPAAGYPGAVAGYPQQPQTGYTPPAPNGYPAANGYPTGNPYTNQPGQ